MNECSICKGEGWVCEDHPDKAWDGGRGCCGGAGMPCICKKANQFKWTEVNNRAELVNFYISVLPAIKEAAKKCGYAIGLHGSLQRDLDLIAIPWVEQFSDKETLVREIHRAACGLESQSYSWESKPNGRVATVFPICWTWYEEPMILSNGHIDLSVVTPDDSARLDWMIENRKQICKDDEGYWVQGWKPVVGSTPRLAIDAAMKEGE